MIKNKEMTSLCAAFASFVTVYNCERSDDYKRTSATCTEPCG